MRKKHFLFASVLALLCSSSTLHAQDFKLTSSGYFKNQGVDVMAFDDIYPEGHQGGVCIIMNGHRGQQTETSAWKPRPDNGNPYRNSSTGSSVATASPPRCAIPTPHAISPDSTR